MRPGGALLLMGGTGGRKVSRDLGIVSAATAARPAKPNILWLIAEDFSPDLGCYGTTEVSTPNLDKLAGQGVRYTRCFTTL